MQILDWILTLLIDKQDIYSTLGSLLIGVLLAIALFQCFTGYKLRRIWVPLNGFGISLFIILTTLHTWLGIELLIVLLIGLIAGVLAAILTYRFCTAAVFLWNGAMSFSSVYILLSYFIPDTVGWRIIAAVLGLFSAALAGMLVIRHKKPAIILSTAINEGFSAAVYIVSLGVMLFNVEANYIEGILLFVISLCLAGLGLFVQMNLFDTEE